MSTPAVPPAAVHVVVAAKALARAKSRLVGALPQAARTPLVLALLTDTVTAARRCPRVGSVSVVTADPDVAAAVRALGAAVVDEHPDAAAGLDGAVLLGAEAVRAARGPVWVAALQGDLPALRPAELDAALAAAVHGGVRALVVDADGTGTTLLAAPGELDPAFGAGSAAAHTGSGATPLAGRWPGLRRDVDTPADLAAAVALGVGPATTTALAGSGAVATVAGVRDDGGLGLRRDDGTALDAPAGAVAAGGWRSLRVGQRVRVHADAGGRVFLVTVPGLSPPG